MRISPRDDGAPIISIDGSANDQLIPLTRQRQRLAGMLAELDRDEWARPSRCDQWTVQDVVAHLVGVNAFWQSSVQAGLAGTPTRMLAAFDPAGTPLLMVEGMRALTPAAVLDQFVASNDGFLAAVAELDETQWITLAESPAGHVPIRLLAFHALWDSWVHERDIALPLAATPAIEADEVASCLRYAAAVSPALAIGSGVELEGSFAVAAHNPDTTFALHVGPSVEVRDLPVVGDDPCLRGDAVALVEALTLRAPMPESTPAEWVGLLSGLATAFDTEVSSR